MTRSVEPRGGVPRKRRASEAPKPDRRRLRLATPRVAAALADAAAERERIAALIEQARPELAGTVVVQERPVALVELTNRTEGDRGWSLGQARLLFGDGYPLASVVARTGWGAWWFSDLLGPDGYARAPRSELSWAEGR